MTFNFPAAVDIITNLRGQLNTGIEQAVGQKLAKFTEVCYCNAGFWESMTAGAENEEFCGDSGDSQVVHMAKLQMEVLTSDGIVANDKRMEELASFFSALGKQDVALGMTFQWKMSKLQLFAAALKTSDETFGKDGPTEEKGIHLFVQMSLALKEFQSCTASSGWRESMGRIAWTSVAFLCSQGGAFSHSRGASVH